MSSKIPLHDVKANNPIVARNIFLIVKYVYVIVSLLLIEFLGYEMMLPASGKGGISL